MLGTKPLPSAETMKKLSELEARSEELGAQLRALKKVKILKGTNEGTFSAEECHRAVGTGDPKYGLCEVYTSLGSETFVAGVSMDRAPGHIRWMKDSNSEIQNLRKQAKKISALKNPLDTEIRKIRDEYRFVY